MNSKGFESLTYVLQRRRPSHYGSHQVCGGINYLKLYYFVAKPSRINPFGLISKLMSNIETMHRKYFLYEYRMLLYRANYVFKAL